MTWQTGDMALIDDKTMMLWHWLMTWHWWHDTDDKTLTDNVTLTSPRPKLALMTITPMLLVTGSAVNSTPDKHDTFSSNKMRSEEYILFKLKCISEQLTGELDWRCRLAWKRRKGTSISILRIRLVVWSKFIPPKFFFVLNFEFLAEQPCWFAL